MNKIKFISSFVFLIVFAISCAKKDGISSDLSFLSTAASGNLSKIFDISNDNSGNVKITPIGNGVTSFTVNYGHGTGTAASATVLPGSNTTHSYPEGSYTVSVIATDIAGHQTTTTYPLQLTYRAPENLAVTLNQNIHNLKVSAKADFAASFLVYFGDVANEVGTPLAIGATASHDYATSGNYNVKVVALSGGAATTQKITVQKITDPFAFPIDFESAFVNYFFGTFDDWGQQQFATVANPNPTGLNTSAMVGMYTAGHAGWSGTYSPLNAPIDFSTGNKVKVWVYNPDPANIGKKLNVELEAAVGGSPANGVGVLKVPFTTSGVWEELVFDFSTIPAIPATAKYNQLVLRFDDGHTGSGPIFYVDNFRFTN